MQQLRVGMHAKNFLDWGGGIDFIAYLANGLALNPGIKVIMFVPSSNAPLSVRFEKPSDVPRTKPKWLLKLLKPKPFEFESDQSRDNAETLKRVLHPAIEIVYYKTDLTTLMESIKVNDIDVFMPTMIPFGAYFPIPWVGYVWDFQHKRLPQFLDEHEQKQRDIFFRNTLTEAPSVIVNAQAIKDDLAHFYPDIKAGDKITALPFAPNPKPEWLTVDPAVASKKYKLPKTYFMISNQFWIHKDHMTAVKAMAELAKDSAYDHIHLVCTGKMEEPREPTYIDNLKKAVTDNNLDNRVHFLGYLPKEDQIGILRGATALLQPTLVEGGPGGGAAYNAAALGVPIIASDIPVNKEINVGEISFFKVGEPADLAAKIKAFLKKDIKRPSDDALVKLSEANQKRLGEAMTEAVERAAGKRA
jgi:glycosyltransferase involved in cell wall biosynthesis